MAEHDRWRDESDRYRGRDEYRDRSRPEGGRFETDYDRNRREGGSETGFGRGSRDFSGGGYGQESYGSRPRSGDYGSEWGRDEGRSDSRFGREDTRYGSGRSSGSSGYGGGSSGGGYGRTDRDWRENAGRSSSEMAFGRDASGRDYRSDRPGGYGRDEDRGFFERAGDEIASWFGDDDAERRRRQDARENDRPGQGYGQHRGRGPKSYQRSDERIRDDINDRLTDDWHLDAGEIDVSVSGREVTLSGTVKSRSDKRRAEDIAEAVSGVGHVQNNLRVQDQSSGSSWSDTGAGLTGTSTAGSLGASGTDASRGTTTGGRTTAKV